MKETGLYKQVLDLPFRPGVYKRFDSYVDQVFAVLCEQLGFIQPMLFMEDGKGNLVLTKSVAGLSVPLTATKAGLVRSFKTGELIIVDSYHEIFPEQSETQTAIAGIDKYVLLPALVFGKPIGVFFFASKTKDALTDLESIFLRNFANQVGLQLYTGWALQHVTQQRDNLAYANTDFVELIEVKKEFLLQIQSLMTQSLHNTNMEAELQQEIFSALSYLQSLILLSDSTVQKHQIQTPPSVEQNQIQR